MFLCCCNMYGVAVHPGKVLNYVTYDIITCAMSAINTGVNISNTFPGEYFNPVIATTKTIRKTVICRTYNVVVFTYSASRHLRNACFTFRTTTYYVQ